MAASSAWATPNRTAGERSQRRSPRSGGATVAPIAILRPKLRSDLRAELRQEAAGLDAGNSPAEQPPGTEAPASPAASGTSAPPPSGTEAAGNPAPTIPLAESSEARMNPGSLALAAAYQMARDGKRVTLAGACRHARVDRGHVREKYPESHKAIMTLAKQKPPATRGTKDARTRRIDGIDDPDGRLRSGRRVERKPIEDDDEGSDPPLLTHHPPHLPTTWNFFPGKNVGFSAKSTHH